MRNSFRAHTNPGGVGGAEHRAFSCSREPEAVLPPLGCHAGDYFAHRIGPAKADDGSTMPTMPTMPKISYDHGFRRDGGRFLWPAVGENSGVLKWVIELMEGTATAKATPIGLVPAPDALDPTGPMVGEADVDEALDVDRERWNADLLLIHDLDTGLQGR